MAQRALCWASLETLLWYSSGRYRTLGWTLKADQVQAYYVKDELSLLQGTQTKTPQENSRWKAAAGPSRALKSAVPQAASSPTAAPVGRWEKGFGYIVSSDGFGGISPTGYGGIYWIYVFYDPGHTPGLMYCTYLKKGVDGSRSLRLSKWFGIGRRMDITHLSGVNQ